MKKGKILVAAAIAIMVAPAALNSLPENIVEAAAGSTYKTTPVYDAKGKITGRSLAAGTRWKLGQQVILNGVVNYQVGINEYIPAASVSNVVGSANQEDDSQSYGHYLRENSDLGKTVLTDRNLGIVDIYGNETGRTIPAHTQWKVGQILYANKQTYYQVATNEFISTNSATIVGGSVNNKQISVTKNGNFGKVAIVVATQSLVDSNGNAIGIVLPIASQWNLGKYMTRGGVGYYQVATNEWIIASGIHIESKLENGSYITNGNAAEGKTGIISTNNAPIVNGAGMAIGRNLSKGSQWKVGSETLHYNKQLFYQVATDEFVSDWYMKIIKLNPATVPMPGKGLIATLTKNQRIYDSSSNSYDKTLYAGTAWKVGHLVVNKYGAYWGQVATNQWVNIANSRLNSSLSLKNNSYYEPEFATNINK